MLPSIPASLLVPRVPSVEAVKLVPVPGKRKTLQRNFTEQMLRRWDERRAASATAALAKQRPPIPRKPLFIKPPIVRSSQPKTALAPSATEHMQTAPDTDRAFLLTPKRHRPDEHGKGPAPEPSAVPAAVAPLRPPRRHHEARKAQARQAQAAASRLRALEEAPKTRFQRFKDRVAEALPTPLSRVCRALGDCVRGPVAALRRRFQL
jgi:hypothetical protein